MNHYDTYKPSGIDWVSEIPSHWTTIALKRTTDNDDKTFIDGDWIESKVITTEGIRYLTTGNVGALHYKEQGNGFISEETFHKLNCTEVFPGDLLISRLNEPIGRACMIPDLGHRIVTAVDNVIFRPHATYDKRFLMYEMNCAPYAETANMIARGSTMQRISRGMLGQFKLCIPPLSEQEAIAAYLDKRCGEIDKVITTQERRIELLREMKQSIITRAVTKGINPNAPMKDSGVEWIGDVPEHWEVSPLKHLISFINGYAFNSNSFIAEGEIPVYRIGDISDNCVSNENNVFANKDDTLERFLTKEGDLLLAMSGATTGKVGIVKEDQRGYINQRVGIIRSNFQQWVFYSLCTNLFAEYVTLAAIGSAQPNISTESFGNYTIALPPDSERQKIEMYIKRKTKALDAAITKAQREVELLRELKQATITEVVTGKRKVC